VSVTNYQVWYYQSLCQPQSAQCALWVVRAKSYPSGVLVECLVIALPQRKRESSIFGVIYSLNVTYYLDNKRLVLFFSLTSVVVRRMRATRYDPLQTQLELTVYPEKMPGRVAASNCMVESPVILLGANSISAPKGNIFVWSKFSPIACGREKYHRR
jgi:hypothetical protein